jgi:hypothetical protein
MWHVWRAGEVLVGRPGGRRLFGIPRRRWNDNIERDLPVVGCGGMKWIDLAQDRDTWQVVVNPVMNLRVP